MKQAKSITSVIKFLLAAFFLWGCSSEQTAQQEDSPVAVADQVVDVAEVISHTPAENSIVTPPTRIVVNFNDDVSATEFAFRIEVTDNNGTLLGGQLELSTTSAVFTLENPLAFASEYQVAVVNLASAERLVEAAEWQFFTANANVSEDDNDTSDDANDTVQPAALSVTGLLPQADSSNVSIASTVSVSFSETIASDDFAVQLQVSSANGDIAGTSQVQNNQIIFQPDEPLAPGVQYTATISNGSNAVLLVATQSWQFTTLNDEVCADHYDANFSFVEGLVMLDVSPLAEPAKGVAYNEPEFNTCVLRATDHSVEAPSGFARNDYSRRQAFNADHSLFIVYSFNGWWHLYDANTLAYVKRLEGRINGSLAGPAADAEIQWDPVDPNVLYFMPNNGGLKMYSYDVRDDTTVQIADFAGRLPWPEAARLWTKSEGAPSADGRYWGFQVETDDFSALGAAVWDKQNDVFVGTIDFADLGVGRPDHSSMSPSGEYIVLSWDGNDLGTTAFSRDFSQQVKLHTKSEHSDIALLPNGNDAYVAIDYQSSGGPVFMVEIQTGIRTNLFSTYIDGSVTALHISGKAFSKPGWVLVSTYGRGGDRQWLHEKVFALSLEASPQVLNLAHHHSASNGYWTEPHASVSRDFSKVLFNTNWDSGDDTDIDTYMIVLPDF